MEKTKEWVFNPALYLGVGLFPLIMIGVDFRSALIYSALVFLTWFLTFLLISAFRTVIAHRVRFICYTLVMIAVVYLLDSAVYELYPKAYSSIGGIIMALFGSGVVFFELERTKNITKFKPAILSSFFVIFSYVVSMLGVGLIREFLSSGKVLEKVVLEGFNGFSFFSEVAGGLLIVVVIAFVHNIVAGIIKKRKKTSGYLTERYLCVIDENDAREVKE